MADVTVDGEIADVPGDAGPAAPALAAEAKVGALTLVGLAALGVPVAAVWYAVAPHLLVHVVHGGGGSPVDPETKAFIADDGWFFVLTAAVGVACGVVAYLKGRRYGVGLAVGLGAGGLAGAVIAWKLGTWFGSAGFHHTLHSAAAGRRIRAPLSLRAKGAVVAWPVGALVAFVIGTAYGTTTGPPAGEAAAPPPVLEEDAQADRPPG